MPGGGNGYGASKCQGYGEAFKNLFASGRADMDILDRAVKRVLTAKFRMGLFEHPLLWKEKSFAEFL